MSLLLFLFLLLFYTIFTISIDTSRRRHRSHEKAHISRQKQSKEEMNYIKYHKCADVNEAYGASYFITKEYLMRTKVEKFNLTWVNCEMGSFVFLKRLSARSVHAKNLTGVVIQSLDVLDFSVIHLSAYERLQRRHKHKIKKLNRNALRNDEKIEYTLSNTTNMLMTSLSERSSSVSSVAGEVGTFLVVANHT